MKVLITGGAGFIGSHLAAAWVGRGAEVVVLDNLRTGKRENLAGIGCRLVEGSIEDAALVAELCRGVDVVNHLAAMVSVPESVAKPAETEAVNVVGTLNVLEGCRRGGVGRLVFASTCAVYGMVDRPLHREHDLPEPISPYAISKLAGEHYLAMYRQLYGLPTVALRCFNVYGPRQDPNSAYAGAVAIFSRRARRHEPLTVFGDGEQTRDFIFVEDVVAAYLATSERGEGVYNVAAGRRITVNDLAREIVALGGSRSEIVHAPDRPGDVRHSRGDTARLESLGWAPKVPLAEGLRRTLDSHQAD